MISADYRQNPINNIHIQQGIDGVSQHCNAINLAILLWQIISLSRCSGARASGGDNDANFKFVWIFQKNFPVGEEKLLSFISP